MLINVELTLIVNPFNMLKYVEWFASLHRVVGSSVIKSASMVPSRRVLL